MDRRQAVAGLIGAGVLSSCRRRGLTIGSKNFTEQRVLGEIVAQHVEKRLGVAVDRRLDLGGTLLAHQALVSGGIDVYPEYTGTALTAVLKLPPSADAAAVFEQVGREYQKRFEVAWLAPLGFNNSFAMVIGGPQSRAQRISTLSAAAAYRPGWKLGVGYEFLGRPDGLSALAKTYRLPLAGQPVTMDLGLLYPALEQQQVNMVAGNVTDGLLSVLDLAVLKDDRHAFPPYQAALLVREAALAARPGLREALEELSGKITEQTMRAMNYAVDGRHEPVSAVAAGFLRGVQAPGTPEPR